MSDCHKANRACFAVNGIDDSKAADPKRPQAVELTAERLSIFRIGYGRSYHCFDGLLQVGMERPNDLSHMWRDDRLKRLRTVRCFLAGVSGSPKTSSKERPFLRVR